MHEHDPVPEGRPHGQSRRKNPPYPPAGVGSRMLRGLMLCMKFFSSFFNVFKIFVKILVHNEI